MDKVKVLNNLLVLLDVKEFKASIDYIVGLEYDFTVLHDYAFKKLLDVIVD